MATLEGIELQTIQTVEDIAMRLRNAPSLVPNDNSQSIQVLEHNEVTDCTGGHIADAPSLAPNDNSGQSIQVLGHVEMTNSKDGGIGDAPSLVPNGITGQNIQVLGQVEMTNCRDVHIGDRYVDEIHQQKVKEISIVKYMWSAIINSSKFETISCTIVALSVIFCISIVIYHFLFVVNRWHKETDKGADVWYITREEWFATPFNNSVMLPFKPPKLVVIQHSVTEPCYDSTECIMAVKEMQDLSLQLSNSDIVYNYLIGTDGRVYEGRGWGIQSVSSRWFNPCLISIGFIGQYSQIQVTEQQLNRTNMLLAMGLRDGHLDPDYALVGARDLLPSESPGIYLYEAIQDFEHYNSTTGYNHMNCFQIHATEDNPFVDEAPHEWYITREDWLAQPYDNFNSTKQYDPLRLVIINDFPARDCYNFFVCQQQMTNLQAFHFLDDSETAFNFVIGNDGRVYEARGWGVEGGDELEQYQPCVVYIDFFGNYTDFPSLTQARVTPEQVNRTQMLLEEGVRDGYLHEDYLIVGIKDVLESRSTRPGENLYNEIRTWEHYDSDKQHLTFSCDSLKL